MIPLRLLEIFTLTKEWAATEKNSLMKCIWTLGKITENGELVSIELM